MTEAEKMIESLRLRLAEVTEAYLAGMANNQLVDLQPLNDEINALISKIDVLESHSPRKGH